MLRFTIRDVLWLMVVVGLGCGWAVDRWREPTLGNLYGHVNLSNAPLNGGWIGLVNAQGKWFAAKIGSNGTFELSHLPLGDYAIAIDHPDVSERYALPSTIPLRASVRNTKNEVYLQLGERAKP